MNKHKIRAVLKTVEIFIITGYLLTCLCLYIFQDKFIYFPNPLSISRMQEIENVRGDVTEINIRAQDGTFLSGWLVNKSNENVVYYFGGNAEEVSFMIEQVQEIKDSAFVLINYRGYGESGGEPSQKKLFSDSLTVYDYFQKEYDYSNIVIMGRSLGTGIALNLASKRATDGVILVTPYDSMVNLAKEQNILRYFPVGLLLHEKYESNRIAEKIKVPTLILMAQNDTVVPNKNTNNLMTKFGDNAKMIKIPDTGHNSISQVDEYWASLEGFLIKVQQDK